MTRPQDTDEFETVDTVDLPTDAASMEKAARRFCASKPLQRLAKEVGADGGSPEEVAKAYARGGGLPPEWKRAAERGCLDGIRQRMGRG